MRSERKEPTRGSGRAKVISPVTIQRLSLYLRYLEELTEQGLSTVSSRQLGDALALTGAQVRKDLAYFGQFGRPGVGYHITELAAQLRSILGTDKVLNVAVVGAGSLGRALLRYRGGLKKGFRGGAAFDAASSKIGRKSGSTIVQPMSRLARSVRDDHIRLAVLAVPASVAQKVTDQLCRAGVKGILNFAPVTLTVPAEVALVRVDLAVQLEQLNYLANKTRPKRPPRRRQS